MMLLATLAQTIFHPGYFFPTVCKAKVTSKDAAISLRSLPAMGTR